MDQMDCPIAEPGECPGLFCGRVNISDDVDSCYSDCMACPRGYRIENSSSECVQCFDQGSLRDYLFLAFFSLLCVCVRLSILNLVNWGRRAGWAKIVLAVSALSENLLAYLFTLLSLEPTGSLSMNVCRVDSVSDFYPIFFNPSTDYVTELQCNYEVVYPRYSMVFMFFAYSFLLHLISLVLVVMVIRKSQARTLTEFAWLLIFPAIVLLYAVLPGPIYYSFEYLTILSSLFSFVVVTTIAQITKYGFKNTLTVYMSLEYWVFAVVSMLCLTFGLMSLTERGDVVTRAQLIPLVVSPVLLHPVLSYFASPKQHLDAYRAKAPQMYHD